MAEKSFGVKEINLIGVSGTPTIESPNNLNLNAVNVAISTNVSVGGTLTVSGNVSIGGTLIYEDVANIDSVGIITARGGINIPDDVNLTLGNSGSSDSVIYFDEYNLLVQQNHAAGQLYLRGNTSRLECGNSGSGFLLGVRVRNSGGQITEIYGNTDKKIEVNNSGVDINGPINIVYYNVSSNGASAYRFSGGGVDTTEDNPDIYLVRGYTYRFYNSTGSNHPFAIRSAVTNSGGTNYTNGVSGNQNNYQTFTVPLDAPSNLYYQCTSHTQNMQGNIIVTGGSQTGGVTYELISQGASIAAGTYVDISGYKAVYFQGHNDPATNGNNRNGPYISTSNSSNSGVSTQNGRWWRLTYSAYSSASHSPSTSALYYGANSFDDVDKVWMLEIMGLDQTNVFLRTSAHNSNSTFPTSGWSANTQSAISTPYLYFHQALLQYIVYGVK